jgi:hypothetical protein
MEDAAGWVAVLGKRTLGVDAQTIGDVGIPGFCPEMRFKTLVPHRERAVEIEH